MASGLDGFYYEVTADGKAKKYHFWDPEDATNVADTSVDDTDSDGKAVDSRESAEVAYSRVRDELTKTRDARIAKANADVEQNRRDEEARVTATQKEFLANAQEQAVAPAGTEKNAAGDTQTVYNTDTPKAPSNDDKKGK